VDENTKLIIVNLDNHSVAIEVDCVVGITVVKETKAEARPGILNAANTDFVGRVAELDGKIILLIDLPSLIPPDERKAMIDMLEKGKEE
jgi:purine-binding chemotaxis protein CheW